MDVEEKNEKNLDRIVSLHMWQAAPLALQQRHGSQAGVEQDQLCLLRFAGALYTTL